MLQLWPFTAVLVLQINPRAFLSIMIQCLWVPICSNNNASRLNHLYC